MKLDIVERVEFPAEVSATLESGLLTVKGPKGEVARLLRHPQVNISVEGNAVVVGFKNATKREKRMINTFAAHVRNMVKGVQEPFVYKLKICSGHFPMNVSVQGD